MVSSTVVGLELLNIFIHDLKKRVNDKMAKFAEDKKYFVYIFVRTGKD